MPLASEVAPERAQVGLRGTVAIEDGYAFFHRFPDRRVDEADIKRTVPVLAEFIEAACTRSGITRRPIALAFSNGAIMAAALLLSQPSALAGAILLRPLSPFMRDLPHRIDGTPVLIIDGEQDDRRAPDDGLRLAERLIRAGALVTHHVLPVGHLISAEDQRLASLWLQIYGR
ncbi:hydrolase [Deinococcus ruber]|uniref:Hydrolase n=2 Tax=Deinococcus ruber TaxID=1848197 RepID=A0A918CP00_9DEIO|nr:hydrolase [Deinococcus ruber]